ncbi:MAG: PA2779 family protein [Gammaproteobacteria bacterium]|nr:PA2779 family protein [Gammaproteobacteria bacterium]
MHKGNGFALALTLAAMLVTSLPARAGIVGTEHMVAQESHAVVLGRIEHVLAGEAVAAQLQAWGVAPEEVSVRLAALSDVELQRLEARMGTDPAGGVLVVIGVVFVVLIILEVLGITNIFRRV